MRQTPAVQALLCAAVASQSWVGVEGELVLLATLTRHGSRAPNPVIKELCPNNEANRMAYNVPPGQLTEDGMKQAAKLGAFLRETYVDSMQFLPPMLGGGSQDTFSSRFMSDPAERCLQTAQAMAQGLFPNGTGPPGFPNQPVAVQTEQKEFANLLAAAHGACAGKQKADNKIYDESRGKDLIEQSSNVTNVIAEACGTPIEDYAMADNGKEGLVLGVKDVADMLDFDQQQDLPRMASVSKEAHEEMAALAFTLLQERYYSSREQVTYWAGDLPTQLLADFNAASKRHGKGQKPQRLYIGYHGHRELLYGFAHLIGWNFDVRGMPRALETSSIPPATTMVFELHFHATEADGTFTRTGDHDATSESISVISSSEERTAEDGYFYVRTYTWTPQFGQQEVVLDVCSDNDAGKGCPLATFEGAILGSMVDTGSWQEICHHVPFTEAEEMAKNYVYGDGDTAGTNTGNTGSNPQGSTKLVNSVIAASAVIAAGTLVWLGALTVKAKWLSSGGQTGMDYESVA